MGVMPAASFIAPLLRHLHILLIVLPVVAGVLWLLHYRRSGRQAEATCAACGYIVHGISSMTCPECGGDLWQSGIVPPHRRARLRMISWCLLWSAMFPLAALLLADFLQMVVGPWDYHHTITRTVLCNDPCLPVHLEVGFDGTERIWGRYQSQQLYQPYQSLSIQIKSPPQSGHTPTLTVDLADGGYWHFDRSGHATRHESRFGLDALTAYFQDLGYNTADPRTRDRIEDILQAIQETPFVASEHRTTRLGPLLPDARHGQLHAVTASAASPQTNWTSSCWTSSQAVAYKWAAWLAGILLLVGWHYLRRPRRPQCARCNSFTEPGALPSCPHCGTDLRQTGLLTARLHYTTTRLGRGMVWAAMSLIIVLLPLRALCQAVLPHQAGKHVRSLVSLRPIGSDACLAITVAGWTTGWGNVLGRTRPPYPELTLLLVDTSRVRSRLQANLLDRQWTYTSRTEPPSRPAEGFGPQALQLWLADAGLDPTAPHLGPYVEQVCTLIRRMSDGREGGAGGIRVIGAPPLDASSAETLVTIGPPPWIDWMLGPTWVVLWLAGMAWFDRSRRRVPIAVLTAEC